MGFFAKSKSKKSVVTPPAKAAAAPVPVQAPAPVVQPAQIAPPPAPVDVAPAPISQPGQPASVSSALSMLAMLPSMQEPSQPKSDVGLVSPQAQKLDVNNQELMRRITELKAKRDQVKKESDEEQAEVERFEEHFAVVKKRIDELTVSLKQLHDLQSQHDQVIWEAETAYNRLLESSKSLLSLLGQESVGLAKPMGIM